jgi:hypothetical protein
MRQIIDAPGLSASLAFAPWALLRARSPGEPLDDVKALFSVEDSVDRRTPTPTDAA